MIEGLFCIAIGGYFSLVAFGRLPISRNPDKNRAFLTSRGPLLRIASPLVLGIGVLMVAWSSDALPRIPWGHSPTDMARTWAQELRPKLPLRIDEHTELSAVEAQGARVTYDFYLPGHSFGQGRQAGLTDVIEGRLRRWTCSNRQSVELLSNGVSLQYRYWSNDGHVIASFGISHRDCGG